MRRFKSGILTIALWLSFLTAIPSITNAWQNNYVCTSRYGPAEGYGRPSREGEYSAYWKKRVKAGEFIIFQYKPSGKEYWFHNFKCKRINEESNQ